MDEDDDYTPDMENPELVRAAADGDLEECQALLQQWKQRLTPARITARHLAPTIAEAISSKHPQVVSYLLKQGAVVSGNGMVLALSESNPEASILMFQTFLDNGWDINSRTDLGNVILKHIISNEKMVRWFLAHGADPNPPNGRPWVDKALPGATILDIAAANTTPTIFDLLVSHGARLADCDALHSAAGELKNRPGRVEMMAHILALGLDVNAIGRLDYPAGRRIGRGTPLHEAVSTQQTDRIEFLLQRGASLEIKNTLDETPLEYAVAREFTTSENILRRAEEAARGSVSVPSTSDTTK